MSLELEKSIIPNKERVRLHRERRKNLGLKEIKVWVIDKDVPQVHESLRPFIRAADNLIHEDKGGKYPKYKLSSKKVAN
jgi:hypothetical protein